MPLLRRLRGPGARRWYFGAAFGLVYQVVELWSVWAYPGSLGMKLLATVVLVVIYLGFLVIPPIIWFERPGVRIATILGFWAFTFVLFPIIGITTVWVWSLVVVMASFVWLPRVTSFALVGTIIVVQLAIVAAAGWPPEVSFSPFITFAVGFSMVFFAQLVIQNQLLRDAHAEIARLAVSEERARLARDLHDSLGHSLTVVAVKSELAGKLVSRDPGKAESELADIEKLAREGLADLRSAVAGYRDADLDAELASARIALDAAGIAAHLPADGSAVDAPLRPLFGWVVREGVTNVIRHSDAANCWIEFGDRLVKIRDDGTGDIASELSTGNGLRGLAERAATVGARVSAARHASGGFELEVAA